MATSASPDTGTLTPASAAPDISVVVPLYNESESLPELEAWIARVMADNNFSYEILFIDDGSTDGSWDVIKRLSNTPMSAECRSAATTANRRLSTPASHASADGWSSPWMPTCRIRPTKSRSSTA